MATYAILRDAGKAMIRAPLLWLFSLIASLLNISGQLQSNSLLSCLALLLIPIAILAQAGQIKTVQLYHEGAPTSFSQIVRQVTRKIGPLIILLLVSGFLLILLVGVYSVVRSFVLSQPIRPETSLVVVAIVGAIIYPLIGFAQCGIVISDLSVSSSLPMVFRALKKDAFTVIALVVLFGLASYLLARAYIGIGANIGLTIVYYLVQWIVSAAQTAAFTFAYFYCVGDVRTETTTSSMKVEMEADPARVPPSKATLRQQRMQKPSSQQTLKWLFLGIAASFLGYLLAYHFFHEAFIAALHQNGSIEAEQELQGYLGDPIIQLCCGWPVVSSGILIALVVSSADRFGGVSTKVKLLIVGIGSFLGGSLLYLPYQVILFISGAF
jgi:hypothetical protein